MHSECACILAVLAICPLLCCHKIEVIVQVHGIDVLCVLLFSLKVYAILLCLCMCVGVHGFNLNNYMANKFTNIYTMYYVPSQPAYYMKPLV